MLLLEPLAVGSGAGPPSSAPAAGGGWRLSLMVQRTADEMMAVHSAKQYWEAALEVAAAYRLDCDQVYRCG